MRFVPDLSLSRPASRLGVLAVAVSLAAACSSASSAPSILPSEIEGPTSPIIDFSTGGVDPTVHIRLFLSDALAQVFLAPSGRVERRTSLGVVGFETAMISTLTWDVSGGRTVSRMEASGPLATHPEVTEMLAARAESARADDRLLTAEQIALEQQIITATIIESIGDLPLVADATGRLIGERIAGDTVERITVEIQDNQLLLVVLDFGHAGAGGRDEWSFMGA